MLGCGAKIEIGFIRGFITRDHDGFDAKANLTIITTRRLQDATSEEAPYWTGLCALNVIVYYTYRNS